MLADFFEVDEASWLDDVRSDRLLYGTDFPNIPYAWDRELKWLAGCQWDEDRLARVCSENAADLYQV